MDRTPSREVRALDQIELDHQDLFRQLSELRAALRAGIRSEVESTLTFVRQYMEGHFAREEHAMSATAYPLFHVHRAAHGRLAREVRALEDEWGKGGSTPVFAESVLDALTEWFDVHIMELDAQLLRFLRTSRGSDPARRWPADLHRSVRRAES